MSTLITDDREVHNDDDDALPDKQSAAEHFTKLSAHIGECFLLAQELARALAVESEDDGRTAAQIEKDSSR